jgi:hypothetical protein
LSKSTSISIVRPKHDDNDRRIRREGAGSVSEDPSRAAWLRQARSYLRHADPVRDLAERMADGRLDPDVLSTPGCYLDQLVFELQGAPPAPSHP